MIAFKVKRSLVWLLFAVYFYILIDVLIFKLRHPWTTMLRDARAFSDEHWRYFHKNINLVPMDSFVHALRLGPNYAIEAIGANLLALVPLGVLVPLMFPKFQTARKVFYACLTLTLSIETAQLFLNMGQFDIDDIMLNVGGGMLGFAAFSAIVTRKANRLTNRLD